MGRGTIERPKRLSEKLKAIRLKLDFTQIQMYEELIKRGVNVHPGYISLYEIDDRIPSLLVLLEYSRISSVSLEILIDDDLELPF